MKKHFIRLLTHARVNDVLCTPDDGILAVTEGEKIRLVDTQGVAEDLTDEFDPEDFPAAEGEAVDGTDTEAATSSDAEATEPPKPSGARKPRKTKG